MLAFASTPLFEPFAIPLLLEKLSSSLLFTKVESLRYLSYCSVMYGALYLCIELLAACRYLVLSCEESSVTVSAREKWCCMLQSFCYSLTEASCCTLVTSTDKDIQNAYIHSGGILCGSTYG